MVGLPAALERRQFRRNVGVFPGLVQVPGNGCFISVWRKHLGRGDGSLLPVCAAGNLPGRKNSGALLGQIRLDEMAGQLQAVFPPDPRSHLFGALAAVAAQHLLTQDAYQAVYRQFVRMHRCPDAQASHPAFAAR